MCHRLSGDTEYLTTGSVAWERDEHPEYYGFFTSEQPSVVSERTEELRDRLGLEDVVTVLQHDRLGWCGHVWRKDNSEWVKKCVDLWLKVLGQEVDQREHGRK